MVGGRDRRRETDVGVTYDGHCIRSRHRIRAGQVLRLPDDGSAPLVVSRSEPPADGIYRVRRGDSLSIVSARFGVISPREVGRQGARASPPGAC